MIQLGSVDAGRTLSSETSHLENVDEGVSMSKGRGQKCPVCSTWTVYPHSVNQLRCSQCKSTFPVAVFAK